MDKKLTKDDLHEHLENRMEQRGISLEDINRTLSEGWTTDDARPGTEGKTFVFNYNDQ